MKTQKWTDEKNSINLPKRGTEQIPTFSTHKYACGKDMPIKSKIIKHPNAKQKPIPYEINKGTFLLSIMTH